MAEPINEKSSLPTEETQVHETGLAHDKETSTSTAVPASNADSNGVAGDAERNASVIYPEGWLYRRRKIGPFRFPAYASPATQLTLVAFVCFLCPGMFNAINGLGGGGGVSADTANKTNIAVYATFSIVGFFSGSIVNRIGVKWGLGFGGIGYVIYVASYLSANHRDNLGFSVFAGCLLGMCAGILWASQGAVMLSYPGEGDKGKYISWFWMIFNLGAVIGGLIPLGQNIDNSTGTVTDGTYIGFIVLTLLGAALAFSLVNSKKVVRNDGSRVILQKHPSWKSELLGLMEVLRTDFYIVLFFPMFFSSNFFYTYQFQDVNLAKFNTRTRSLNSVLYYLSQIVGAFVFGYALDSKFASRKTRAKIGLFALFTLTMVIYGGGLAFQDTYDRESFPGTAAAESKTMDWTDSGYIGPMFLFMFYGFYDAAWQTTSYWFMGALSNNARKLTCFTGFYKGIQSAGGAAAPAIDLLKPEYVTELAANWGLLAGSLVVAAPIIFLKIKDHTSIEEDLKFSDETLEEVKGLTELDAKA